MPHPLRTTVVGSYPFPGWLEFAAANLSEFGPADIAEARVSSLLRFAPAEKLSLAPDCGLSQTARWAAKAKLASLCEGVRRVRETL